jgi:hypothetical protein
MINTPTVNLVNHAAGLTKMRDDMKARYQSYMKIGFGAVEYSDDDRENIRKLEAAMRPWLETHELHASLDRLDRVMAEAHDSDCHILDLAAQIEMFQQVMEDELSRKLFFCVPDEDMKFYRYPEKFFAATWEAFPSAKDDIREACRAYSLEIHSGCVFHAMGILQSGLYALATDIGVTLRFPFQLADWCQIIRGIEDKIKPMRDLPRSAERDEKISFYSECAAQFHYFKDAWRNHICHMRESYKRQQAHSILTGTKEFMECLSRRVREVPLPSMEI